MHRWSKIGAALLVVALPACGSPSAEDEATEQQLAGQLVAATQDAGVAPRLTPEVAAALYGTDASPVCDAFDGGLSTASANRLLGNPGHGRRNNITDQAVVYARLVVETYCPDVLPDFDDAVDSIDPVEVTR
jgi:hypothetical protein